MKIRPDRFSRLADLVILGDITAVDRRAGRTHCTTDCPGQVVNELEGLSAAYPGAAGHDHVRVVALDRLNGQPDGFHFASAEIYRRLADLKDAPPPVAIEEIVGKLKKN